MNDIEITPMEGAYLIKCIEIEKRVYFGNKINGPKLLIIESIEQERILFIQSLIEKLERLIGIEYKDCDNLLSNNINCCMSCEFDDANKGGSFSERKDKKGNIWYLCCNHTEFFESMNKEISDEIKSKK